MSDKEQNKDIIRKTRWGLIIKIIIAICCVSFLIVTYVRITTDARLVYREAKNVRLAFQMMEVESYASGKPFYDFTKMSGLAEGAIEELAPFMGEGGSVRLTAYNRKARKVTGFVYSNGKYIVTYTCDEELKEHWKVDYCLQVFHYDGE